MKIMFFYPLPKPQYIYIYNFWVVVSLKTLCLGVSIKKTPQQKLASNAKLFLCENLICEPEARDTWVGRATERRQVPVSGHRGVKSRSLDSAASARKPRAADGGLFNYCRGQRTGTAGIAQPLPSKRIDGRPSNGGY